MSTEPNNNHSNTGTRNAGIALVVVSVIVALFYVSADSFGYKLPDSNILLALFYVLVDSFWCKLPDWLIFKILLVVAAAFVSVVSAVIAIFITSSLAKKIANFLGKEEFHTDIKLFICPLILIVIISMFAFLFVNSNYENIANGIVTTCKSNAPEKKKKSEKTEKRVATKR